MKIGYNEATAKGCSTLAQDLELCEACGFDYIEIRLDMLRVYLKTHPVEELQQFFATHHLKPHAFNALYTYADLFSVRDTPQRQKALLDDFLLGCSVGQIIGAHAFIVVPPMRDGAYQDPFEGDPDSITQDCVRILTHLSDLAQPYDLNLCFELVGAPKCSVRTIPHAKKIVEQVNRPNVGFVFDPCNIYMYHQKNEFSDILSTDPQKLFAVHINDYDAVPEQALCPAVRCLCGEGIIDLQNFLSVLKTFGYDGMVSIETFRPSHWAMRPQQIIPLAYQTTHDFLEKNQCL